MDIDIAIYNSRGQRLYGFDLDRDFVVSFDDGIWWYISFDNNLLIGARIDNVKDSEDGRYNRYMIFGKFFNREMNIIKAFIQLLLQVKKYFDDNGLIWEEDIDNLVNSTYTTINDEIVDDDIDNFLKKIISTLIIRQKAIIPVEDKHSDKCSIVERIKILNTAQKIVDYFDGYVYTYKLKLAYGYNELNAHIWFSPKNKKGNLILCEEVLSLLKYAKNKNIPPWKILDYVKSGEIFEYIPINELPHIIELLKKSGHEFNEDSQFNEILRQKIIKYMDLNSEKENYENIAKLVGKFCDNPYFLYDLINDYHVFLPCFLAENYNKDVERFLSKIYDKIPKQNRIIFLKYNAISPKVGMYDYNLRDKIREDFQDSHKSIIKYSKKDIKQVSILNSSLIVFLLLIITFVAIIVIIYKTGIVSKFNLNNLSTILSNIF